jgi:hypothetical protein
MDALGCPLIEYVGCPVRPKEEQQFCVERVSKTPPKGDPEAGEVKEGAIGAE